jgi:dTMP kinase
VRDGYAKRMAEAPARFARIDAAQSVAAVGEDVAAVMQAWQQRVAA